MSSFDTPSEKNRQRELEERDYREAFHKAQREIDQLKQEVEDFTTAHKKMHEEFESLKETISGDKKVFLEKLDKRMADLEEDNRRLHALIQSASESDMKLVEQMDKNHREKMDQILKLVNGR